MKLKDVAQYWDNTSTATVLLLNIHFRGSDDLIDTGFIITLSCNGARVGVASCAWWGDPPTTEQDDAAWDATVRALAILNGQGELFPLSGGGDWCYVPFPEAKIEGFIVETFLEVCAEEREEDDTWRLIGDFLGRGMEDVRVFAQVERN